MEKWEQGSHLSIERFDDYHGDVPEIDDVHWSIMDDSNARLNRNLDVFTMQPSQFDPGLLDIDEIDDDGGEFGTYGPLDNDETVQYMSFEVLVSYYIVFNTANTDDSPTPVQTPSSRTRFLPSSSRFLSCSVSVPSSNASATCLSRLLSGFWPGGSL
ncbi:hypothetical protein FYC77_19290 [Natrialba swarupiae]|uniref:Uncharacterized protein n=1 Tax=Natrialba swarupiae TaxID=2448032 RepID=A0A5D5AKV1_9EURY|nr:hypothetical protein FYC77_19290 [Natrialba swarupiae]